VPRFVHARGDPPTVTPPDLERVPALPPSVHGYPPKGLIPSSGLVSCQKSETAWSASARIVEPSSTPRLLKIATRYGDDAFQQERHDRVTNMLRQARAPEVSGWPS
jgi:hypothetical protein